MKQTEQTQPERLTKQVQQFYDEYHKRRGREIDDWMTDVYWPLFDGRILEVGAGTRLPQHIIENDQHLYVAYDLSFEAAAQAKSARAQAVIGQGESLPYTDASFDVVACYDVLEHLADPETVIAEMCRVSRRRVVFAGPNYVGTRYAPGLGRETLQSLLLFARGHTRNWYRLDDFHLTYDEAWLPDHDAISAVNAHWVVREIRRHGFKPSHAGTWSKRYPLLDKLPVLRYLGFYLFVVGER